MKAKWNGAVIADTSNTVEVDGNHYFPAESLQQSFFSPNDQKTTCHWKGEASYYDITVNGQVNRGAAWFYPTPLPAAAELAGRVAFWRGVEITD